MKKILYVIIFSFASIISSSQTIEETKQYIENKFKELDLITDSTIALNNHNWNTYHIQNLVYFNRKFLILTKFNQTSFYGGEITMLRSTKYSEVDYIIDISKLSSIQFKKNNNKCVITFYSNNSNSNFKFATEEADEQKNVYSSVNNFCHTDLSIINNKFISNTYPFEITFYTNSYDEEVIDKLKKAFKHLVGLYGGKFINDLF